MALSLGAGVWAAREVWERLGGTLLPFLAGVFCFYAVALACYRAFLWRFPLQEGPVRKDHGEFEYCAYMLLLVFVFSPAMQLSSVILPFPLRRTLYVLLGTRAGRNTNFAGMVVDPPLVELGANVAIGLDAIISGHSAEGPCFVLARVRIGDGVTIGGRAIILPGVTIGEGAIVGAGAVVPKGARIGPHEVWGGVPARWIKNLDTAEPRAERMAE